MKSRVFALAWLFAAVRLVGAEPAVIPVWPGVPAGSEGKTAEEKVRVFEGEHIFSSVHRPTLTVYLPATPAASRGAVLVIPGGGHREIWFDHEGVNIARALNAQGIAAFVLKYRLAREEGSAYTVEQHSLADAQHAMQLVRSRAAEFGIDPTKLGVMGFSAGGELAALVASRALDANPQATDVVERVSSRPAFQALIYPGNAKLIVPARGAPPAFLLVGENDAPAFTNELLAVYRRFREAGVSAELHVIADAGHGFGLRASNHGAKVKWLDWFVDWMSQR